MADSAIDNGTTKPDTAEHSISNRINTSNLSGYQYYAATLANYMDTADNALASSTTHSKTMLNSISQAIRPFK